MFKPPVIFLLTVPRWCFFCGSFLLFEFRVCLSQCLVFHAAVWSPAGKWLTSWLYYLMFPCIFVTFPYGVLGQESYLIVSFPDLCLSFIHKT